MKLRIITTQKQVEYDIEWAELNTPAGNMIIGPAHAPLLIELTPKAPFIYKKNDGTERSIHIIQAIAHVKRDSLTLLIPIDLDI